MKAIFRKFAEKVKCVYYEIEVLFLYVRAYLEKYPTDFSIVFTDVLVESWGKLQYIMS